MRARCATRLRTFQEVRLRGDRGQGRLVRSRRCQQTYRNHRFGRDRRGHARNGGGQLAEILAQKYPNIRRSSCPATQRRLCTVTKSWTSKYGPISAKTVQSASPGTEGAGTALENRSRRQRILELNFTWLMVSFSAPYNQALAAPWHEYDRSPAGPESGRSRFSRPHFPRTSQYVQICPHPYVAVASDLLRRHVLSRTPRRRRHHTRRGCA